MVPDIGVHNFNTIQNPLDVIVINTYLSKRVTESPSWKWLTTLIWLFINRWFQEAQARLTFRVLPDSHHSLSEYFTAIMCWPLRWIWKRNVYPRNSHLMGKGR